ncbi:hypothetical protein LTR12_009993 [Friedmanniomyces endolithicus]|nr:hypothetical protein LTR12_009993 [Friedmanniomyces endolithicus]
MQQSAGNGVFHSQQQSTHRDGICSAWSKTLPNRSENMEKLGGDFDFDNVPIIVTDYDADSSAKEPASSTARSDRSGELSRQSDDRITAASICSTTTTTTFDQAQQWSNSFSDFADALWNRMTGRMRQKLREACVEVLRRTDDPSEVEKLAWAYDEDARFLD